jgi:hypothetical protein
VIDDMIRDILGKLQVLADAPTQNLNPNRVSGSKTDSRPPQRAGQSNRFDDEKDKVSLFEWYSQEFAAAKEAGDEDKLCSLYLLAVADYVDYRYRPDWRTELRKGELDARDPQNPEAGEREAAARVVRDYEGKPAHFVATIERVNVEWVHKARRWHARNPRDGRERPAFYEWDDDRRRQEVEALAALKLGCKAIGQKLGVDKNTVKRYLPKEAVEREPVAA